MRRGDYDKLEEYSKRNSSGDTNKPTTSDAVSQLSRARGTMTVIVISAVLVGFLVMIPAIVTAVRVQVNTGLLSGIGTSTILISDIKSTTDANTVLISNIRPANVADNSPVSTSDFCRYPSRTLDYKDWSDHPPRRDTCLIFQVPASFINTSMVVPIPSASVNMNRLVDAFAGFFLSAGDLSISFNNAVNETDKYRILSCYPTTYQDFADELYCNHVGKNVSRETWFSSMQTMGRAKVISNQRAFGNYRFKQMPAIRLEGLTETSFKKHAFNTILPFPVMNSPTGITVDYRGINGDNDIASSMNKLGIPFAAPLLATHTYQEMADANRKFRPDSVRLAQLYLLGKANGPYQLSMVNTIMNAGYNGLILTQDNQGGGEMRLEEFRNGKFLGDGFFDDGFGLINAYNDPFAAANIPGFPSNILNVSICGRTKNKTLCNQADRRLWRSGIQLSLATGRNGFSVNFYNWTIDDAITLKQRLITNYGSNKLVLIKAMFDESGIRKMINGCLDGFWLSDHHQRFAYNTPHPIDLIATYSKIVDDEFANALVNASHPRNLCPPELRFRQNFTIVMDSGIREGVDVLRALALGADVVGMGLNTIIPMGLGAQRDRVNGPADALIHRYMMVMAQAAYDMRRLGVANFDELKLLYRDEGKMVVQPDAYDNFGPRFNYDSFS